MTDREDIHNHRICNRMQNHLLLTYSFQYGSEQHRNKLVKWDNEKITFGQKSSSMCHNTMQCILKMILLRLCAYQLFI